MAESRCFFVSDLHGRRDRYRMLFRAIEEEQPSAVFLGGDLMPSAFDARVGSAGFLDGYLEPGLRAAADTLGGNRPRIFLILGNDDARDQEAAIIEAAGRGVWEYLHLGAANLDGRPVFGYACVPPTPFMLKDWERYDVSRYVDPGCVSPEEGHRSVEVDADDLRHGTIAADLQALTGEADLHDAIFLFHSPPYKTKLDRAALDGMMVDHVPLDVHVGSIAIQRFIDEQQPLLTLHGHVHESARLTGAWRQRFGRTHAFSAAHDGPELALVRFDLEDLEGATRELI